MTIDDFFRYNVVEFTSQEEFDRYCELMNQNGYSIYEQDDTSIEEWPCQAVVEYDDLDWHTLCGCNANYADRHDLQIVPFSDFMAMVNPESETEIEFVIPDGLL